LYDHVEAYIDESGDLGFSPRSSKHLVIAAVATTEPRMLSRVVRRTRRKLGTKDGGLTELKFNGNRPLLRRSLLEGLAATDSWIVWGAVVKSNTPLRLKADKNELYRYLVRRVVSDLSRRTFAKEIQVLIDRRSTEPMARRLLENRVESDITSHHAGLFPPAIRVGHQDSANSEGLQVADHVAGAVFQGLERSDGSYLAIIADKVVHGEVYW
jgi:hypothetical protein